MLTINRRVFLTTSVAGAIALHPLAALAQSVNVQELHGPGQLGQKVLGPEDAPVTIVEYASFTCPHCATFHNDVFGDFKAKYIDTGQVRYIFREFLRNGADVAITAIARCAPADRYFDVVDAYFSNQDQWLRSDDMRNAIFEQAKAFDFTQESFDACLSNQTLLGALDVSMQRAQSFGVTGTPTFFANGEKQVGALPMEEWDRVIGPMLAAAGQ